MLTYVCAKYFEGAGEQIKEYNIAVEALGRPADFDQKRDSIVRVEAHRLRKRLREYYEADGADHAIRIEIPPGQYAPRFLPARTPLPSLSSETLVAQDDADPEALVARNGRGAVRRRRSRWSRPTRSASRRRRCAGHRMRNAAHRSACCCW